MFNGVTSLRYIIFNPGPDSVNELPNNHPRALILQKFIFLYIQLNILDIKTKILLYRSVLIPLNLALQPLHLINSIIIDYRTNQTVFVRYASTGKKRILLIELVLCVTLFEMPKADSERFQLGN